MFPHKKFFSNVPCPDNEDQECSRPYCHFFHRFKTSSSSRVPPDINPIASQVLPLQSQAAHVKSQYSSNHKPADAKSSIAVQENSEKELSYLKNEDITPGPSDTTEENLQIDESACSSSDEANLNIDLDAQDQIDNDCPDKKFQSNQNEKDKEDTHDSEKSIKSEEKEDEEDSVIVVKEEKIDVSSQPASLKVLPDALASTDLLKELVNEAVRKCLSENPLLSGLDPSLIMGKLDTNAIASSVSETKQPFKRSSTDSRREKPVYPDYNPTPISELNKRKDEQNNANTSNQNEEEMTDFSASESDCEASIAADFDLLDEVMAENSKSSKGNGNKAKEQNKKLDRSNTVKKSKDRISDNENTSEEKEKYFSSGKGKNKSNSLKGETNFNNKHILVPPLPQMERKTWTPGSSKISSPDNLESILEKFDGSSNEMEVNSSDNTDVAIRKADLAKELLSLSSDTKETPKDSQSDAANDDKADSEKDSTENAKAVDQNEKSDAESYEKPEEHSDKDDSFSDYSLSSRKKRKRSRSRSSSLDRRRKKKRRKEKRSKRRKSKKRRGYSSQSEDTNDDSMEEDKLSADDDEEFQKMEEDSNDPQIKKETDSESESRKSRKRSKDKHHRRKHSKHKHRSKKKYRKRRYRSSSSSDYSSSEDSYSRRRRRMKNIDLSIVKQEKLEVIDLTVIKDESDSDKEKKAAVVKSNSNSEAVGSSKEDQKRESKTDEKIDSSAQITPEKPSESILDSNELEDKQKVPDSKTSVEEEKKPSNTSCSSVEKKRTASGESAHHNVFDEITAANDDAASVASDSNLDYPDNITATAVPPARTKSFSEISMFDSLLNEDKLENSKHVKKENTLDERSSSTGSLPDLFTDKNALKKKSSHGSSSNKSYSKKSSSSSKHSSKSSGSHNSGSTSKSRHSSSKESHSKSSSNDRSSKGHSSSSSKLRNRSSSKSSHSSSSSKSDKSRRSSSSNRHSHSSDKHKSKSSSKSENKVDAKTLDEIPSVSDDNGHSREPSPLPDLSALDAITEEDWESIVTAEEDESVTENECLQLYEEFQKPPTPVPVTPPKRSSQTLQDTDGEVLSTIKRVARPGATGNLLRKPLAASHPARRKTPGQVMLERYEKLKAEQAELAKKMNACQSQIKRAPGGEKRSSSAVGADAAVFPAGVKKPRIPGVSNVRAMLQETEVIKKKIVNSSASAPSTSKVTPTPITAGGSGVKRIAHVPKTGVLSRPVIASEFGSKVPQVIRQRYLNSFIDEAIKITSSQNDAFRIALAEEKICYRRATSRCVYLQLAVNATKRLRGGTISEQAQELIIEEGGEEALPSTSTSANPSGPSKPIGAAMPVRRVQSHFSTMAGGGQKGSWSIEKPSKASVATKFEKLKGAKLYEFVQRYKMTEEQLDANGYPRAHPDVKGKAVAKVDTRKKISPSPTERYCARCGVVFLVDKWGYPRVTQKCVYHWGRSARRRGPCGFELRYSCCQGDNESDGCCLATCHVSDNYDPNNLTGFVRTLPKDNSASGDYGVYALDCEMCYTSAGNELTRITVVNTENVVVYEKFVQPDNPVIDYNTRFSGITDEDLENVETSLVDVQAALLARFSAQTVLVGHSLESDLMALKIIHGNVIDTSVMFPHKMGPPYKRALRNLASDYLKKIIQNDVGGHDSAEDATACMELLHWKIKEDLKTT